MDRGGEGLGRTGSNDDTTHRTPNTSDFGVEMRGNSGGQSDEKGSCQMALTPL
jgi:hypothetical protein